GWCPEAAVRKPTPDERMVMGDSGELRYACDKCGRSYLNKTSLSRHKRLECDRKKRFWCNICFKGFFRNESLVYHQITHR
ncbi:hypothetical protein LSTR_LSTR001001, partial [Laodelphax striatellus]